MDEYGSSAFTLMARLATEQFARNFLLEQGTIKLGQPSVEQAAKIAAINDLTIIKQLMVRLMTIDSWHALLRGR